MMGDLIIVYYVKSPTISVQRILGDYIDLSYALCSTNFFSVAAYSDLWLPRSTTVV